MKIEEFKHVTIAYMRNIGEYGPKNEMLMEEFKNYLKQNNLFGDDSVILGIALDNPAVTSSEKLRYDVGLIINEDMNTDLASRTIDDGRYAIFDVAHTRQGVMDFWQSIPQLTVGLAVDYEKPVIERYAADKIANHLCEFCIPLKS